MAKLFPFRPETTDVSQEPRLVNLDDETADDVFAALSSDTARAILEELYEEPTTASEVADAVDTSLQNARYHLDKLKDAGLVEEVDTWYSSRGTEMTVYAPTNEPLVVAAGREESTGVLKDAIKRVLGAVGVLGVASLAVDRLARMTGSLGSATSGGAGGGGDAGVGDGGEEPAAEPIENATKDVSLEASRTQADAAVNAQSGGATGTPTATPRATATDGGVSVQKVTSTPVGTPEPTTTGTPAAEATRTVARTVAEEATPAATSTPVETVAAGSGGVTPEPTAAASGTVELGGLSPGALFFAGGVLAVALVAGWWYLTRYRPLYR